MKLKNLNEQTIVITGATSGIGLTTARMAAEQGANVVLVARNEDALRQLTNELNAQGARAAYVAADVADETALRRAAELAKTNFGGFDTWVNNAGGSVYGRIMDVPTDDFRRLFDTNVWGVVNGSRIAAEYLREKGGAIINVGSEVSDAPVPLQALYSASKHAVKGFTDALRMELEADSLPISVTLIKPTAIHTPFPENAKNYLPYEPQLPPPVYAPDLVAEAILHAAVTPTREFFVGGMAKAHSSMALNAPRLYEKMNETMIDSMQNSGEPANANRPDGLYQTNSKLQERGSAERYVLENSLYQQSRLRPVLTAGLFIGGGIAVAALLRSRASSKAENGKFKLSAAENFGAGAKLRITEHMKVVGSDGEHVGTVDKVQGENIKLTKNDSPDGQHHQIPTEMVESVEADTVMLTQTAEQTRQMWKTAGGSSQNA